MLFSTLLSRQNSTMNELPGGTGERRRALTCTYCRHKKIKCGRTHPCENCRDHGKECVFPFVKRRVGSKRDKPKKVLEERLARMESLLARSNGGRLPSSGQVDICSTHGEQQPQLSNSVENPEMSPGDVSLSQPPGSIHHTRSSRPPLSATWHGPVGGTDQIDDTNEDESPEDLQINSPMTQGAAQAFAPTSSLAQSQNVSHYTPPQTVENLSPHVECADLLGSEVGWEYHGPTSFLSICSIPGIAWVSESSGEPRFFETAKTLVRNVDSRLKMRRDPRREPIAEPDEEVSWKWCQAYFDHSFDASLGLVSKNDFEARLRHHFAQKDEVDDDPAWYALRNTVYASGYRLSSSNMPYSNMFGEIQGQAWRYFEKALDVHTELLYGGTSLMAVQALTAMAFFAEGLGSPSLGYMLASCATRLAQAKGLHRQPAQSWNLPQSEQQHRIQLFWTLYILEKHISYRSGRPSIIDDDDLSCSFPSFRLVNNSSHTDPFVYIVQHAQISSRIARQLASGKSFRQTHSKTLESIQELDKELQQWRDSLPPLLQPDSPTPRHGKCPENINMYHVMYLRYAYYGSIMAIHSILTHPWNNSLFGPGQSTALRNRISVSSHVVVNAARGIILDTDAIHVDASTPIWLAFYFPLVSAINIFIYILKYPALPTASSDVALLDICTGHFSRLELTSPDIALPFVREIARLARATVQSAKESVKSPGFVLGPDILAPSVPPSSVPQDLVNNVSAGEDSMLELFSDNWGTMFSSLSDENLAAFTFDYQ